MANWCVNRVKFSGSSENLAAVLALFKKVQATQAEGQVCEMPSYITNSAYPFETSVNGDSVYFRTPWSPAIGTVAKIALHLGVDYVHLYEEPGMLVLGECRMKNGVFSNVALEHGDLTDIRFDDLTEDFVFEGRHYAEDWGIFREILERKKQALEPQRTRNENFQSTGNMTAENIRREYGDLSPVDLVLKLGQHKNFDAAKEEFDKWDDDMVAQTSEYLKFDYAYHEYNYAKPHQYQALCFLTDLIEEREKLILKNTEQQQRQARQQELIARRLAGKLPHIDINGTDFTIDLRLGELRESDAPWNRIEISEMETDHRSNDRLFFYDTREHQLWELDDDLTELPENVVMVELPEDLILDPVAAARQLGYADDKFLTGYPIQEDLKAGIRQLTATFLPEFIQENISKQEQKRGYRR